MSGARPLLVTRRFIHTGRRGCTFVYQKSMPKLPIPELDKTCQRWLKAVTPIMTPLELESTTKAVNDFQTGAGPALQERLKAKDKGLPENSYINDYWEDMYLSDRSPLPYNYNPFLQLIDDTRTRDPCVRAASLVESTMHFYRALKDETLEPDIYHMGEIAQKPWFKFGVTLLPRSLTYYAAYAAKSYPLDMSQYPRLFSTTRLPSAGRDKLKTVADCQHITVLCGNRVYKVRALTERGLPVGQAELERHFRSIYTQSPAKETGPGVLTALRRDQWANLHPEFVSSNAEIAQCIESSLMVVALDHRVADSAASNAEVFLHSRSDRWYDKSFQLIVSSNGRAAINFEHAWGDGVSVLRLCNEIVEDSLQRPLVLASSPGGSIPAVSALPFRSTPSLASAAQSADGWMSTRKMHTADLRILDYGKNFFKSMKIAPDGAVQNAIQLGYRMAFGKTVATYESASTAGFKRGRTETIRPATVESLAFVLAMLDSSVDRATQEKTLREAADAHRQNSTNAAIGQGMDRHLFALRKMAEESGTATPAIFSDPSYARMNYNILSTSTLVSPFVDGGGFAPVVPDGYGIGYGTTDDGIGFVITTYNTKDQLDRFVSSLDTALRRVRDTLTKAQ